MLRIGFASVAGRLRPSASRTWSNRWLTHLGLVGVIGVLITTAAPAAASSVAGREPIAHVADCRFGYHGGPDGRCVPDKQEVLIQAIDNEIKRQGQLKRTLKLGNWLGAAAFSLFGCPPCGVIMAGAGMIEEWQIDDLIADLTKLRNDPPDQKYTVLVRPTWTPVRTLPPGLSPSGSRAVLLLLNRQRELGATLHAMTSSYEKAQGADEFEHFPKVWFGRQVGNTVTYTRRAATLLDDMPRVRAAAARALAGLPGAKRRVSRADAARALARLKRSGFSRSLQRALQSMGLSSALIARLERDTLNGSLSGLQFPTTIGEIFRASFLDGTDRRMASELRARAEQLSPNARVQPTIAFTSCPASTVQGGSRIAVTGRMTPAVAGSLLTLTWTMDWGSGSPPVVHKVHTDAAGGFSDAVTTPNPIQTYPNAGVTAVFAGDATRKPAGSYPDCRFRLEKVY